MSRILRYTVDLHSPHEDHELYCVEAFVTLGKAKPARILHFGVKKPMTADDVDFISSRIDECFRGLTIRNVGCQAQLEY